MGLYEWIMMQMPDDLDSDSYEYYNGFSEASRKAANLAKEADELMAMLMDALEDAADMLEVNNELGAEAEARAAITKFYNWKDQTK